MGGRLAALLGGIFIAICMASQCAAKITAACSACEAIADSLQRRLDAERPRNHLDYRHRLDGEGKRYGKVVDYKMSELRIYELLETLCDDMVNYQLGLVLPELDAEEREWRHCKVMGDDKIYLQNTFKAPKHERSQRDRELKSFCAGILEEHEEHVEQYIYKLGRGEGQEEAEESEQPLADFICKNLTPWCRKARGPELIQKANFVPANATPQKEPPPSVKKPKDSENEMKNDEL